MKSKKEDEITILKERIDKLEQQISNTTTTNNIQNNIQNIRNIQNFQNNFGSETHDHITTDFIRECIHKSVNGVQTLIEKIHFSQEVPENNNVWLKSTKKNLVEVVSNQKWVVKDANEALEAMIHNGQRMLSGYYFDPESGLLEKELSELDTRIQNFLNSVIDRNNKHFFTLRRRIMALIIEHHSHDDS